MLLRKGKVLHLISVGRRRVPGVCLSEQQTEIQQRNFRKLKYNSRVCPLLFFFFKKFGTMPFHSDVEISGISSRNFWLDGGHPSPYSTRFGHLWLNGVGKCRLKSLQNCFLRMYLEENMHGETIIER